MFLIIFSILAKLWRYVTVFRVKIFTAILSVSLTSTLVIYGLFSNPNQIQQNKQEFSKTNPLKFGKGNQEIKKVEEGSGGEKPQSDPKGPPKDDEFDFENFIQEDDKIKH